MGRILVCGTLAWDTIGRFDTPLTPGTRNVKLERLDESFGGCAMNIAYNLRLAGVEVDPFAYVGDDFEPRYADQVRRCGIGEAGLIAVPGARCARGIVFTGSDGAQFTAFYPGPTELGRVANDLGRLLASRSYSAVILAPDLPARTLICARRLQSVPLRVWCPGQYAELIDAASLRKLLTAVDVVVINRHEWRSLRSTLGSAKLPTPLPRLVVTAGPDPVLALPDRLKIRVHAIPESEQVDPTGCGDAFVAALTVGLLRGAELADAVRAGIALAARCLRAPGAQAH